jgi:hypothetical protein
MYHLGPNCFFKQPQIDSSSYLDLGKTDVSDPDSGGIGHHPNNSAFRGGGLHPWCLGSVLSPTLAQFKDPPVKQK